MNNKIICAVITFILISILLVSCSKASSSTDKTVSNISDVTVSETDTLFAKDNLPDLDFEGTDIVISIEDYGKYTAPDFYVEAQNGDVVNDSVFQRNQAVSERLNVNLVWKPITHSWDDRDAYTTAIYSSVMANEDEFDLIAGLGYFVPGFVSDGILRNMSDLPYLDLEKPWWAKNFMEKTTVDGKYYFVTGDASLGLIKNMFCVFINLGMVNNIEINEKPYQLVNDGKWTLDKLSEITKTVYSDLNGNGKIDNEDQFGLLINSNNHITGFIEPFDVNIVNINSDNKAEFVFGNEHNISVVQKLCEFVFNTTGVFYDKTGEAETANNSIFKNNNILFATGWLMHTDAFRDLTFDYGVVPYPKWNEEQDTYSTTVLTSHSTFALPVTCKKIEMVSAFMEAFASESYRIVTPAYFETALKVKYAHDNETSQMFDIIRAGVDFDFGVVFTNALNGISDTFKSTILSNNINWASKAASIEKPTIEKIDSLMTAIKNLGDN